MTDTADSDKIKIEVGQLWTACTIWFPIHAESVMILEPGDGDLGDWWWRVLCNDGTVTRLWTTTLRKNYTLIAPVSESEAETETEGSDHG